MLLPLKIAIRFLKSNKLQTLLIALGIGIGISVQVFIGTLIQGLQKSLIDKTISHSPQITVLSTKDDKTIENWKRKVNSIENSDERIKNVSPVLDSPAFIKIDKKTYSVVVRGFDLETADQIYNIKDSMYEGKWISQKDIDEDRRKVLIGRDLNEDLKKHPGDTIKITTPTGGEQVFIISGFYDLGVGSINKTWLITDLRNVQRTFNYNNKINSIEAQIDENHIFESDSVAESVKYMLDGDELKVEHWQEQNKQLLSGLKGQSMSSIIIQIFVVVSVVLAIASILVISVVQKSKEIGILKAMGIKDFTASLIFLFEGFILGIFGAIIGVSLGLFLTYMFSKFAVNPDKTPIVKLYIDYNFVALSIFIALASSSIASFIPSKKSAKLNPIEVIKNG